MSLKIAVASKYGKGLEDIVSEVFGKTEYFTIVEIRDHSIESVQVVKNPGFEFTHGSGPIAAKELLDLGVRVVIAAEVGPTVGSIFKERNVEVFKVKAGISVEEALSWYLRAKER